MKSILRFFLGMIALGITATSAWAQTQAGVIKAARVTGTVTIIAADGSQHAAAEGAVLTETDTVVTAANSGLVLVFMNGSSVKLGANSRLLIEEFKMDPLGSDIAVSKLTKEPSSSQTKLNLAYGDMVGDVKKLSKNSTYGIKTPVGAAGIRGTTFRIVFTPAANGQPAAFTLSTAEGLVVFTGTTGAPVEVPNGAEVVVTAEVNTATGAVSSVQVTSQGISTEASAAIQTAVTQAIQQAQQAAVFTPAEQTPPAGGGGATGNEAGAQGPEPTQPTVPAGTLVQPVTPTVVSPSS
jgi:hypothetical protein